MLVFILDEHCSALYDDGHQQRLAALLTDYFGEILQVSIYIDSIGPNMETPATYITRCQRQRLAQAEDVIANDGTVKQLIKQFNAKIVEGSINPIDN